MVSPLFFHQDVFIILYILINALTKFQSTVLYGLLIPPVLFPGLKIKTVFQKFGGFLFISSAYKNSGLHFIHVHTCNSYMSGKALKVAG